MDNGRWNNLSPIHYYFYDRLELLNPYIFVNLFYLWLIFMALILVKDLRGGVGYKASSSHISYVTQSTF